MQASPEQDKPGRGTRWRRLVPSTKARAALQRVDDQPMRTELFSVSQLERHARTLAGWHEVATQPLRGAHRLLTRLDENQAVLRDAYGLITAAVTRGRQITPAAEWFIDNYHLIEEQIRTARRHLPRAYNRELPQLANGPTPGTPRVYDLALELISHSHGRVDDEGLRAFITSYQSVEPLRLGELWAIPIMLRLALLENLRRVVSVVTAGRRDREQAATWVAEMIDVAANDPAKVVLVLADMVEANPPLTSAFVSELASRLQSQGSSLIFALSWIDQRLAEQGGSIEQAFQLATQSQAADQVAIGNSIGSLRYLAANDWRDFVEAMSVVERNLRDDPAGVYAKMDFATRDRYRHVVERVARRSKLAESQVAAAAVELAKASPVDRREGHVGYFLIDDGLAALEAKADLRPTLRRRFSEWCRRSRSPLYAGSIVVTTALFVVLFALAAPPMSAHPVWWVVLGLAANQLAIAVVHWAATMLVYPATLPRLDFAAGIPPAYRTLVAVPTMLTDAAEVDELLEALEVRFLANRDANLAFALITDFGDAAKETVDSDAALLTRAQEGVVRLNATYPHSGGFFLFHRPRRWNAADGVWMGWERKRGKLEELNAALRGEDKRFSLVVGPLARITAPSTVCFVIALDSDTALPRDAARLLAATLAHPLNRAVFDARKDRVTEGYAILQPRVSVSMDSIARSRFARLFGGEPGIDPYTRAVSDVYQDVFGEGSFVGKGIYDIDALRRALHGRFPENRVLSHDLLEGAHARAGLVSDVLLVEDYPSTHDADVARRHRWIRGDWQLTPWLFGGVPSAAAHQKKNPISGLSRWKVFDNLRRSVVPVVLLALLLIGWALAGAAAFATLSVVLILALPGLLSAGAALSRRPAERPVGLHPQLGEIARAFARQLGREAFAFACLPFDAYLSLDAIVRTATRVLFTRKRLLEWRTARAAARHARVGLARAYISMWIGPALAIGTGGGLYRANLTAFAAAAPVLALWALSPAISWWLSRPLVPTRPRLAELDAVFLRGVARRTWRFFEAFVTAEDHFLPPDNFQEDPPCGVAHRTSPTNIALALTSTLAAYDFGYLSSAGVVTRTTQTMDSLDKLPRYRGHFFNWYDTVTLEPLRPMYVSTVDSGNLAGHLMTLGAGLGEIETQPILRPEIFAGLRDTLAVLAGLVTTPEVVQEAARVAYVLSVAPTTLSLGYNRLRDADSAGLARLVEAHGSSEAIWWVRAFAAQRGEVLDDLVNLAPWLALSPPADAALAARLDQIPSLAQLARLEQSLTVAAPDAAAINGAVILAGERAAQRLGALRTLTARCHELADVDYDFLYDRQRHLLSIGYNVTEHRLDAGDYDLLASEARLASFIAIAQGKLPQEHWFSLGRLLTSSNGRPALMSWSGSMFEYLMPLCIMPTYDGTLLDETYRASVERQIAYGRERGVPWGVSESGYNKTDLHQTYQYRAFGVPGLGFKRGLGDDLVVAPYATVMALMVAPEAACANLRRLARKDGELGAYGFYEAIDFTPARMPPGVDQVTIRSFMAHHQGMAFLSLAYLLLDRPMQRRFSATPAFRASELLLQERVPRTLMVYPQPPEVSTVKAGDGKDEPEPDLRVFTNPSTVTPEVHLLSNGSYHVAITNAGGGYSRWRDLAVTRWHEDATRDCWGTFCYLRDVAAPAFWSIAHQPSLIRAETNSYEAIFAPGRAEFRRVDRELDTHVEIGISPEDDIELRRITITNRGRVKRTIELTSFAEVVLSQPAADAAHPAFSNLFVETELLREQQAILCTRRPRSGGEKPPFLLHLMTVHGNAAGDASFETSRAAFLGRGRNAADPIAMHRAALGDSQGAVLDPAMAIRQRVVLEPDETARVHIVTGVHETRDGALALIEKYRDRHAADRVFELSWTHAHVERRRLDTSAADVQVYERLASSMLYTNPTLRAPRSLLARNRGGQSGLWAYGISGDLPIALCRVGDVGNIELVRQLVKAHTYWRLKGLATDLVIWNEDPSGYRQVLHDEIMSVIASVADASKLDRPGGIFVRRAEQISEEDKVLMQTVARLIVADTAGTLAEQVERKPRLELPKPLLPGVDRRVGTAQLQLAPATAPPIERADLVAFNGVGGFTKDGREYVITTTRNGRTPAPWANVLANPWFGSVVTESGGAYTWCENANAYRLTPWHNDAVSDPSGEAFYLRDEDNGHYWSPTPLPATAAGVYTTRHGFGYSVFEVAETGIESALQTYVATDAPVKFCVVKIRNRSGKSRRLSLTGSFELVLGASRSANVAHVVTEVDSKTGCLTARNPYSGEMAARVAFLDCSEEQRAVSGDRTEILGRNGSAAHPSCMARARLSGRVGAGYDPCLAMQVTLDLADGEEREIAFMFGSGRDLNDTRTLINRFRGTGPARGALDGVYQYWNKTLGAVNVQTPDSSLDFLVNGWLMYQVLACRMWGRSGFYQSGGAFGFRDQLQDSMALIHAEPALLREQILRCAQRQFPEGDVQHWWHPPQGRGVRTHISDDYLWLPFAVCRYVNAIGDTGVLDEKVAFLEGRPVKPDEESYYDLPGRSEQMATVYEHCLRAVRHGLRFGEHGLPLMGSGDWNDGMNLVGEHGKGESVWLGFFLYDVLMCFGGLARRRGDVAFADSCAADAALLRQNLETHAWDGGWYRRAYFDDGTPLGSASDAECQIDSLPQSWAVLSQAGEPERARRALAAVDARLVRRDLRVIQLFDPPFDKSDLKPGYVKGYVPGVRENGGQYTHAAVWAAMAFAAAGDAEKAWELFGMINPVRHGDSKETIAKYMVEPYVIAADVYTNPQHAGRGGWTWYTGSAGWMYRFITEALLGIRLEVDRLHVAPLFPKDWNGFDVHYRHRETVYHIHVKRVGEGRAVKRVVCDGQEQEGRSIPLRDDRQDHRAEVEVG